MNPAKAFKFKWKGLWNFNSRDPAGRDMVLFMLVLALAIGGLLILYPASSVSSFRRLGDPEYYVKKQLTWFLVGMACLFVAASLPVELIRKLALPGLVVSLVALLLVFVPGLGHSVSSSRESFHRWLQIGPFQFQPSEFSKVAVMVYISTILSRESIMRVEYDVRKLAPPIALTTLVLGAIILEPQYGTTVCMLGVLALLIYVSGFPMLRLLVVALASLPLLYLLIYYWDYRLDRFMVWLNPYEYRSQGGYQLVTAWRAFREGGLFGQELASGFGHRYLPFGHTDFVLALMAEDFGFLAVLALIGLYLVFLWRAYRVIREIDAPFPFMLGASALVMLMVQTLVNMSVVTGILPTTGISLPFISYGGSSLIVTLIFSGIILNVSRFSGQK